MRATLALDGLKLPKLKSSGRENIFNIILNYKLHHTFQTIFSLRMDPGKFEYIVDKNINFLTTAHKSVSTSVNFVQK